MTTWLSPNNASLAPSPPCFLLDLTLIVLKKYIDDLPQFMKRKKENGRTACVHPCCVFGSGCVCNVSLSLCPPLPKASENEITKTRASVHTVKFILSPFLSSHANHTKNLSCPPPAPPAPLPSPCSPSCTPNPHSNAASSFVLGPG